MRIRVLGSSAGGGFPQWNCNCANCDGLRRGTVNAKARTQSSIAVTVNGADWLLVNASPDILAQIQANPELQPARATRDSGIAAVLLMDAQIDHVTGLLMLRERQSPLPLLATTEVFSDIAEGFPITKILSHYCGVNALALQLDAGFLPVPGLDGMAVLPVVLSSKPPPYSPFRECPRPGDNIGLVIDNPATGQRAFYAPGLGEMTPELLAPVSSTKRKGPRPLISTGAQIRPIWSRTCVRPSASHSSVGAPRPQGCDYALVLAVVGSPTTVVGSAAER